MKVRQVRRKDNRVILLCVRENKKSVHGFLSLSQHLSRVQSQATVFPCRVDRRTAEAYLQEQ